MISASGSIGGGVKNIFVETASASLLAHKKADGSSPLPIPSSNADSYQTVAAASAVTMNQSDYSTNGSSVNILQVGVEDEFLELQKARNRSNSSISVRSSLPFASSSSPSSAIISTTSGGSSMRLIAAGGINTSNASGSELMASFSDKYGGVASNGSLANNMAGSLSSKVKCLRLYIYIYFF